MKIRICILLSLLAALSIVSTGKSKTPLNIVVLLADDLGIRDTACYGSPFYQTPHIDALAENGVRFTQAYSAHPRCVPARHALMTGQFPARSGVPGASYNLDPDQLTIAEALKQAGYATFFAGKWHLSKTPEQRPEAQGFDINIGGGHAGAPGSYFHPYLSPKKNAHHQTSHALEIEGGKEGDYLTDHLTDATIRFLTDHCRRKPEQPFFIYLSYYAVHTPIEAKEEWIERYRAKLKTLTLAGPEFLKRDGETKHHQNDPEYAGMISSLDESVGRIVSELERLGIADETAILFTSDHGGLSNRGEGNQRRLATSNLPYRAGKGHVYEGGIRVPFILRLPGKRGGQLASTVVTGTDLYPTCLDLAAQTLRPDQHLDGVSILRLLDASQPQRPGPLFWHSPKGRPGQTGDSNCSVIRRGDLKLLHFYDENRCELYDLQLDPFEKHDLSVTRASEASAMLQELNDWKTEIRAFQK